MSVKKDIRARVYAVYIMFVLFSILILGRVIYLQYVRGDELKEKSKKRYVAEQELLPVRGNIYSSDGRLLSTTLPQFDIHWDAKACPQDTFQKYYRQLAQGLADITGDRTASYYQNLLKKAKKDQARFKLVKARVSFDQYLQIRELPIFRLHPNIGGLCIETENKRVNPFGLLANRSIGRYSTTRPSVGLELSYNEYLQGKKGSRLVKLVAGNTRVPLDGSELEPQNGKDLYTAIDVNVQQVAENSLLDVMREHNADFGTCILMDVPTGQIRALANLGKQKDGSYWEDYNYALLKQYPGSTFKLVSLMALLEDSLADLDNIVNIGNGSMTLGTGTIRDDHAGHPDMTLRDAFAHSSNVAFAKLIYQNYRKNPGRFIDFLHNIGMDESSHVDLVGEPKPYLRKPGDELWSNYSLAYMAHGYELLVTPMKMCQIYNAVANDGVMTRPHIARRVMDYGKLVYTNDSLEERQICTAQTAQKIREAMKQVVEVGTGKKLKNPYYTVGGKTGTAKWVDAKTSFTDNVYTAYFIGSFPLEKPRYTICVSIKLPRYSDTYYGSQVALPIFKAIADRVYARDVCMYDTHNNWYEEAQDFAEQYTLSAEDKKLLQKKMKWPNAYMNFKTYTAQNRKNTQGQSSVPDVRGMGLKDALYVLENEGFRTEFSGQGKITFQEPAAHTTATIGQKITLKLN